MQNMKLWEGKEPPEVRDRAHAHVECCQESFAGRRKW